MVGSSIHKVLFTWFTDAMAPEVHVYIAMSLDGFIATKTNGLEWLEIVKTEGEDFGYAEFMADIDAVLMGRNTYDVLIGLGDWPFRDKKVMVLTHRPLTPIANEKASSGLIADIVKELADDGAKKVYLDGGNLIRTGLSEGIIDRLTISIIPILLGSGVSLFGETDTQNTLHLVKTKTFASGLVQVTYDVD
jgi:dihydrofolate reductase